MNIVTRPSEPRPDLGSFGTETDRRLVLFVFAILATSIYILHVELVTTLLSGMFQSCVRLATPQLDLSAMTPDGLPRVCSVVPERWQCFSIFLGLLLLSGLWLLIYQITPRWRIRHAKLLPLEQRKSATIVRDGKQVHITTVLEEMRVVYIPKVHLHYLTSPGSTELKLPSVFGGFGQAYLVVPRTLIETFQQDLPAFRAAMLHELAHFYHRDVQKTYGAEALTLAFGLLILLPYLGFTLWSLVFAPASLAPSAEVAFVLSQFWQSLVMVGLIWVLYLAVRRTREVAADVQASYWAGTDTALEKWLLRLDRGRRAWWRVVLDYYPDERVLNVQKPGRLFYLRYWEALTTGITTSLSLCTFFFTLLTFFSALNLSASLPILFLAGFVGSWVPCVLVVAAIGQMIWRAMLLVKLRGADQLMGTGRIGFCLTVGLVLGFLCSLQFLPLLVYYYASWQTLVAYVGPLVLVLVVGLGSFCRWLAVLADSWLEVIDGRRMARWVVRVNLTAACVVLSVGLTIAILLCLVALGSLLQHASDAQALLRPIELRVADVPAFYVTLVLLVFGFMQQPVVSLGLTLLWILPLSSCFWYLRRTPLISYTWALADTRQPALSKPGLSPFNWGLLSEIALLLGVLFCALFLFFHQVSLALASADQLRPYLLIITILPTLIAGLWQGGVAVLLYREMGTRGIVNGLLGAFLTGLVIAGGYFLVYYLLGGTLGAPVGGEQFWPICWQVLSWGSISTWVLLWALDGWLKKRRHEWTGTAEIENSLDTPMRQTFTREYPRLGGRTSEELLDRHRRRRWLWLVSLLLIIVALLLPRYTDKPTSVVLPGLVKNSDFEVPKVAVGQFIEYSAGQTFGDWTVEAGSVDLIDEPYCQVGHGKQSVDMI